MADGGVPDEVAEGTRAQDSLRFLVEAAALLGSSLDYEVTLQRVAQLAVPVLADWCTIHLPTPEGSIALMAVAHADPEKTVEARELARLYPPRPDEPEGIARVLRTGQALLQPEVSDELLAAVARSPEHLASLRAVGFRSSIVVPLLAHGRTLGTLSLVATGSRRSYDRHDLELAEELGRRAGSAVENARLYQEAREARTRAEEAQGQLAAIFEAMADGVFVFGEGGRVLHMNTAARDLFAMSGPPDHYAAPLEERGYGSTVRDEEAHPLPEQQWPLFRVLQGEVLTGSGATDLMVRTADGRSLELSVSGAPMRDAGGRVTGAVCVVRDVTERRRLERRTHDALSALLRMAEALVLRGEESAEDGAAGDQREGTVAQRLAELTCSVLGCRRVTISAVTPSGGGLQPVAAAGLTPAQERRWREGGPHARLGRQLADPAVGARLQAGEVLVLDFAQPPLGDQPNPYGVRTFLLAPMHMGEQMIGVLTLDYGGEEHHYTDEEQTLAGVVAKLAALVVERERLLRERAEARAAELALREANRRMDEFLNIASHELKTPLTSLKATVQLAQRRLRKGAEDGQGTAQTLRGVLGPIEGLLGRTDRQMSRMDNLINDLLDISRIQAGRLALRPAACDLAAIIREAVEEQRHAWPERTITLEGDEGAVPVVADPDRIMQVATNYLTNALKYSAADQGVEVTVRREGGAARVSVRDHGPGIPAAAQEHIWERFYRVEGVEPRSGSGLGLGLGLHISHTIMERHQGQVGVDSAVGQGSTFWFTLPLAAGER